MTISLRLNEKDTLLIKKYAKRKSASVSVLVRNGYTTESSHRYKDATDPYGE